MDPSGASDVSTVVVQGVKGPLWFPHVFRFHMFVRETRTINGLGIPNCSLVLTTCVTT